jgi:NAD(P)-dependent dehydrogenase (short-subunit alcohol dehydrogenase family)
MTRLSHKVALVTGAARSLGAAIATTFAKEGAQVVIGDVSDEEGSQIEVQIQGAGGAAYYVHLDVTRETDWQNAIGKAVSRFGKLDVLVNNASISINRVPIEERTADEWDRIMAVNLKSVFLGTKHALPAMRQCGGGSIVNISSIAGLGQSQIQEPAYATSKAAVRMLSRITATQHAHEKIRCNSLHPGPINSGMLHKFMPTPEALARRLTRVPMGRLATLDEIVSGVLYLASDEASYVTGTELVIDGGALAQ